MLEIKNIKKSFNKLQVLKGISFNVLDGEVVSIIGPSGCGKSTLLRCINLLEKPSSGNIILDGVDITNKKNLTQVRQKMGMVFQQFNLFPHLTVLENITLAPICEKLMDKDTAIKEAEKLLKSINLYDKKDNYPSELSGGQKQRVAIVRTLIMNPEIILFDEPTSALDPEMVNDVLDLIKKLVEKKITIIIVSHEMSFIKECSNKIIFLDGGKIEFMGTKEEAFVNCKNKRLKEFLDKTKR
ncbi:MAG: amino acid ABC transporter ATP-binding protein [bacterium]|nr:amino acid ABC transporter ATP-binding protein [bacterium]MDY4108565.1 amino acid ABC transporter ATP-binding protein [Bacilli bacterium]